MTRQIRYFFNPFYIHIQILLRSFFISSRCKHAYFELCKLNLKWTIKMRRSKDSQYERSYWNNSWNNYTRIVLLLRGLVFVRIPMKHAAHSPTIYCDHNRMELICSHRPRQYSWYTTRYTLIYYNKHTHHVQRK